MKTERNDTAPLANEYRTVAFALRSHALFASKGLLRASLAAAALGGALSARAESFLLASTGTSILGWEYTTAGEDVRDQIGGPSPFARLDYHIVSDEYAQAIGTGSLSGNDGALLFSIKETSYQPDNIMGYWIVTGGTGLYEGAKGDGIFSFMKHGLLGTVPSGSVMKGDVVLSPVPEPASLAALGVGAAGLLRRRRSHAQGGRA